MTVMAMTITTSMIVTAMITTTMMMIKTITKDYNNCMNSTIVEL